MKLNSETKLLLAMAVFVILGGGALFFLNQASNPRQNPAAAEPAPPKSTQASFDALVNGARNTKGDPAAPITIVEFADFECPSCRRAYANVVHKFGKELPVRFVFYHFPLTNVHERAMPAAIAAEAAGKQGKFWPMYQRLFAGEKTELTDAYFDAQAAAIGLDLDQFHKDLKDPSVQALAEADRKVADQNAVAETPTFLIRDNRKKDAPILSAVGGPQLQTVLAGLLPGKVTPPSPAEGPPG